MKEIRFPVTPITEETFKRQGWEKHSAIEFMDNSDSSRKNKDKAEKDDSFFWTLPIPKDRKDQHSPMIVSNMIDEVAALKDFGLKPGQFFVEIMDMDGLGLCLNEEELEILYTALTGENIEETK
jgi:hypothetical protein